MSRNRPSAAASAKAAYFDQNAPERAIEEQPSEGPERQLNLVVGELHDREAVVVDAFEREHGDQRGELVGELARQQPDRVEAEDRRERSEQIEQVERSGEPIDEI